MPGDTDCYSLAVLPVGARAIGVTAQSAHVDAFHITDNPTTFWSVYLRPLNSRRLQPPASRNERAVQYFAYPDHPFDVLRESFPDGRFEAGADIVPSEWVTLQVQVTDERVAVTIDGTLALVSDTLTAPHAGDIGLSVDIGTEAVFRDLRAAAD